jgi:hypothetical protein
MLPVVHRRESHVEIESGDYKKTREPSTVRHSADDFPETWKVKITLEFTILVEILLGNRRLYHPTLGWNGPHFIRRSYSKLLYFVSRSTHLSVGVLERAYWLDICLEEYFLVNRSTFIGHYSSKLRHDESTCTTSK